jgi:hypothetical protein
MDTDWDGEGNFDALVAATQLAALTALVLFKLKFDPVNDAGLRRVLASSLFARLRRAELHGDGYSRGIMPVGPEPFLAGLTLPLLAVLALYSGFDYPRGGLERAHLPALRQLIVRMCTGASMTSMFEELGQGEVAPALEYVAVGGGSTECTVQGLGALGAYPPPSLRAFATSGEDSTVGELVASRFASHLTRVTLWIDALEPLTLNACAALAGAQLPALRVLELDGPLSPVSAEVLAQAPWLSQLNYLVLTDSGNYIAGMWSSSILEMLRTSSAFRALEATGGVRFNSPTSSLHDAPDHLA